MARILSRKAAYVFGRWVSNVMFLYRRADREAVKSNLRLVLKDGASKDVLGKKALEIYNNFSRNCADVLYAGPRKSFDFDRWVRYVHLDFLHEALQMKKGAIILSAHVGNWELGAMTLGHLKFPLTVISKDHQDPRVTKYFVDHRLYYDVQSISTRNALRPSLRVLKNNGLIGVLGDRLYDAKGAVVDFMGTRVQLPVGPAALSLMAGAPIVPFYFGPTKDGEKRFELVCSEPLIPPTVKSVTAGKYTQMVAAVLERIIKQHPDQWFVFGEAITQYDDQNR